MANLTKVAGVADADIEKIDGVAAADISKVGGITKAAAVTGPTVAVAIGEDGRTIYSSTAGFASGSWTLYTLQAGSIDYKDLTYGKQSDGTETWMAAAGNTTNQLVLSQMSLDTPVAMDTLEAPIRIRELRTLFWSETTVNMLVISMGELLTLLIGMVEDHWYLECLPVKRLIALRLITVSMILFLWLRPIGAVLPRARQAVMETQPIG